MSGYVLPALILITLTLCLIKRVPAYEAFVAGAKKGLQTAVSILPSLIAMLCAVTALTASGLTDALTGLLSPALALLGVPSEVAPLALLRPLSGSASLAMLEDILTRYGADSRTGLIASTLMGSSETIFYTVCVYMSAASVKRGGYAVPCALLGAVASLIVAALCFPR